MNLRGEFGWGRTQGKVWLIDSYPTTTTKIFHSILPPEHEVKKSFDFLLNELLTEKKRLKKGKEFLNFPLAVLQDPALWKSIKKFLKKGLSPFRAVERAFLRWENELKKLDERYLRLRIQDLADLRQRLAALLAGDRHAVMPDNPFVAVGKDLYVTELLRLQRFSLQGICLEAGNESAHGVMLAKSLGIPLAGRVKGLLKHVRSGDYVVLNKESVVIEHEAEARGHVVVMPAEVPRNVRSNQEFLTKDQVRITVRANLQLPEEIQRAKAFGAQGVGLFRTEFLWMHRPLSPEEEAEIYAGVIQAFSPDPVIFRLVDFGSDKGYEKISWPSENNPALGWRGLRVLLDQPELLKRQLQALFSAAGKETLHILLPMVRSLDEVNSFLKMVEPFQRKFPAKLHIGVMVETPSCAQLIDLLPKEIYFLSLGTNDLLQYFFAIDRLHPRMKANPLDPAFLRLLQEVVKKAIHCKKKISLCGEVAGDPRVLPMLLAVGLREFSVSIPKIPDVARHLRKISIKEAQRALKEKL